MGEKAAARGKKRRSDGIQPFAAVLNAIRGPVLVLDRDLAVVGANPAFHKAFGLEGADLVGRPLAALLGGVWDDPVLLRRLADLRAERSELRGHESTIDDGRDTRRYFLVGARLLRGSDGVDDFILLTVEDVTEARRAAAEVRFANALLKAQTESSPEGILVVDARGRIVSYNGRFLEIWKVPPELARTGVDSPVLTHALAQVENAEGFFARVRYLYDHPEESAHDEIALKDGRIVERHSAGLYGDDGNYLGRVWFFRDITRRRWDEAAIQDALVRAETQARAVATVSKSDAVISGEVETLARLICELATAVIGCERANVWLFNEDESELRCIDLYEAGSGTHSSGMVLREFEFRSEFRALKSAPYVDASDALTDPRTAGYVETYLKPLGITAMLDSAIRASGKNLGVICFEHVGKRHAWRQDEIAFAGQMADKLGLALISRQRRRAEADLRRSRDLLGSIVENAPVRIFWKDRDLRYLGCNSAFARDAGMSRPEDLLGRDDFQMGWREQAELYRADDKRVMDSDTSVIGYEEPSTTPDGRHIWLRTSKVPLHDEAGKVAGILGVYEDITQRKQAEVALKKVNRGLKVLSAGNAAVVQAKDEAGLLWSMCKVAVEVGDYAMAWIGYVETDPAHNLRPVAFAGAGSDYLLEVKIEPSDIETDRGAIATCVHRGVVQVTQDFATDVDWMPWRVDALRRGFAAGAALPLKARDKVIGAMVIYAREADAFDTEEVALLAELADDMSYGIAAMRDKAAGEAATARVERAMEATIETVAETLEQRDPYTAGHQRRVARLAEAIARRMGLAEDRIRGLHLAGLVHDLGKIHIPAEILSKPTRLTPIEYDLIKTHSEIGYHILKGVDFPWPIAVMVRQHHERMDGTGYPDGLKGDQILMESRIMAVADVVESMTSHRPYRASRGTAAALEEIERGRGTAYDPDAVDACLAVFREDNFDIQSPVGEGAGL